MAAEEEAAAERVVVVGPDNISASASHGDNLHTLDTNNFDHQNESRQESQVSGTPSSSSSSSSSDKTNTTTNMNKGKTCKGCLYYSSTFKSNSLNPLCIGLTRSFPNVPRNVISKSEMEASQAGSGLKDFKYGCIGYSAYSDRKGHPVDEKEATQLPICVGIEILVDRRVSTAGSTSAHVHNKEDGSTISQPRPRKPAHPVNDEFLTRFKRNANLVAMGVVKNMRKVGNRVKESVDDILYPYRRRPK